MSVAEAMVHHPGVLPGEALPGGGADQFAAVAGSVPPSTMETLTGGAPIVVLAPHPDDESLGCGALLAAAFAGSGAHVVLVSDGRRSHPGSLLWSGERLAALRADELRAAVRCLGGTPADITFLGCEDARVPLQGAGVARLGDAVAGLCRRVGARALFATSAADPHCDHVATEAIARAAARQLPQMSLRVYPVWSRWHEGADRSRLVGRRARRLPCELWRAQKRAAIAAHASQHGTVVTDDPAGFVLPAAFVTMMGDSDELFFEVAP